MRSVLMVCHGNICRSPMAATLMRVMAEAAGWDDALWVDSCGVSDEEEGNPMDRRAVAMLLSHGIRPAPHEARRFSRGDYAMYDDILCMEERNRYMVDHASLLIAVHDGLPGGTRRTIEYALRRGIGIVDIPVG